jgi:hypothetical protein
VGHYATRFAQTNRLIAHVDQAVVLVLMDAPAAEGATEFLGRHITWLEEQGVPDVRADAHIAIDVLLRASRPVRCLPETERAVARIRAEIGPRTT